MKLLVNQTTSVIHDASNEEPWRNLPADLTVVEVAGDAGQNPDGTWKFAWPNGGPTRCLWDGTNIVGNPAVGTLPSKPDDELDAALAALDPATITSLAAARTFLTDLVKAQRDRLARK